MLLFDALAGNCGVSVLLLAALLTEWGSLGTAGRSQTCPFSLTADFSPLSSFALLCATCFKSLHIFSPLFSSLAPPPPHISGNPAATNGPCWGSEEERARLHCCHRDLQLNYRAGQLSLVLTCDFRRHAYNHRFAIWVSHYGPRLLSSGWWKWNHLTLCSH